MPSLQEEITGSPAFSAASRIDSSAPTVMVFRDRANSTSKEVSELVLRHQGDPVPVRCQLVEERHGVLGPAAVDQFPVGQVLGIGAQGILAHERFPVRVRDVDVQVGAGLPRRQVAAVGVGQFQGHDAVRGLGAPGHLEVERADGPLA
ncbi:hypothetical protein ACFFIO_10285 [Citricoccus parietis]|uniref:Uncharacterized protein n=1 Tax=Citricoccus parietis TaxID=592307 RepID=A0ABV6F5V0_9MICC